MRLAQAELPDEVRAVPEGGRGPGGRDHTWSDPITGTAWRIAADSLAGHLRRAEAVLPEAPAGSTPEPSFNLAWPEAGAEAWRLADQVQIFAALYFAVSPAARAAWSRERAAARRAALGGPGAASGLADPTAARACRQALAGSADAALAQYRFEVVRARAARIQQYVLESNWLPGIRGASAILGQVEDELGSCLPAPDGLVFAGGGHALAVVPAGAGEETARAIEELYTRRTVTARAVAAHVPADLRAVRGDGYRALERRLEFALARRQHTLLPSSLAPAGAESALPAAEWLRPVVGPARECAHCLLRDARYLAPGPEGEEVLCTACACKRAAAEDERRGLRARFARATGRRLAPVRSLEDIAGGRGGGRRGAYVGFLYGDGNGLGGVVARLGSLPALRHFSLRLNEAAEQAVFTAVAHRVPDGRAELVLLGGDDLRLFVPGRVAWSVANDVAQHFEEAFRNRSTGQPTLTMAVGVAIAHVKTPIAFQNEVVGALLHAAKRRAKEEASRPRSAVDIAVLDSFETFADGLEAFRRDTLEREDDGRRRTLTARPFTLRESQELRPVVCRLGALPDAAAHRAQLYRLAQAVQEAQPAEADLFLAYQLARVEPEWGAAVRAALRDHARALGAAPAASGAPSFYVPAGQGALRTAWLDVLELLDFAAETDRPAAEREVP